MTRLPAIAAVGLQCMVCAHARTDVASRTNRLAPPNHLRVINAASSTNQLRPVTTIPGKVWRVRENRMVLEDGETNSDQKFPNIYWPTNAAAAGVRTNSVPPVQPYSPFKVKVWIN